MTDDIRELVRVVTIDSLESIPGADLIEAAKVGGWTVVVQKGLYQPGDEAVYFEIDSCLPLADSRFEHLRERGFKTYKEKEYHRLKTVKLRGVVSQGMLMPVSEFKEIIQSPIYYNDETEPFEVELVVPNDLTTLLGILKYDDMVGFSSTQSAGAIGSFPSHAARKTDSERVQNLYSNWDEIRTHEWSASEKIDGCSLTVVRLDGKLKVCSRNWEVRNDSGVYGAMYQKYLDVFEELPEGWAIQAEIAGPGIQGNRLNLKEQRIFVFNVTNYGATLAYNDWPEKVWKLGVPWYNELTLPETPDQAIAQVDGIKSLVSPDRLAEGVVWVNETGESLICLGDRHQFKVISNRYLLKEK